MVVAQAAQPDQTRKRSLHVVWR